MPSIMRPLTPAETTSRTRRAEARVLRAAHRQGWPAVGGNLASQPVVAIVAPRCQIDAALELLPRAEQRVQVPDLWRARFDAERITLPPMADGYVCVVGMAPTRRTP